MPRVYSVHFNNVSVSAVQDLFELQPADDKPIELIGVFVSDYNAEINEQRGIQICRRTGAFTGGSGGTAPTPQKRCTIDPSAGFTAEVNNTTQATGGTEEVLHSEGYPSQGGFAFTPVPGAEPQAIQGEALIVKLLVAPGASTPMSGTAWVRELP